MRQNFKKDVITAFRRSDAVTATRYQLSAANLLVETAHYLMDDIADTLASAGLGCGEAKHLFNGYEKAFDKYHALVMALAGDDEHWKDFNDDLEAFIAHVARHLGIAPYVTDPATGKAVEPRPMACGQVSEQVMPDKSWYEAAANLELDTHLTDTLLPKDEKGRRELPIFFPVMAAPSTMAFYLALEEATGLPAEWFFGRALLCYALSDDDQQRDKELVGQGAAVPPVTFCPKELDAEKLEALGTKHAVRFVTYDRLKEGIDTIADKEGRAKQDVYNEALLTYLAAHILRDKEGLEALSAKCLKVNRVKGEDKRLAAAREEGILRDASKTETNTKHTA